MFEPLHRRRAPCSWPTLELELSMEDGALQRDVDGARAYACTWWRADVPTTSVDALDLYPPRSGLRRALGTTGCRKCSWWQLRCCDEGVGLEGGIQPANGHVHRCLQFLLMRAAHERWPARCTHHAWHVVRAHDVITRTCRHEHAHRGRMRPMHAGIWPHCFAPVTTRSWWC